jgi:hypothetical protein
MDNIENIRKYRNTISNIAEYMISNEKAVIEFGNSLEWIDLEMVPTWLLWEQNLINHLVMISGTIFLLPSIKIWIDSKKIQEVRTLVGDDVFDFLITNTQFDDQQVRSLSMTNVADNIISAGASVILSSYSMRIRPWLIQALPKSKGKLEQTLAQEILKHALYIIEHTKSNLNKQ